MEIYKNEPSLSGYIGDSRLTDLDLEILSNNRVGDGNPGFTLLGPTSIIVAGVQYEGDQARAMIDYVIEKRKQHLATRGNKLQPKRPVTNKAGKRKASKKARRNNR